VGLVRRARPNAARIQARVVTVLVAHPHAEPYVVPLAVGFFQLERMRAGRSAGRPKLKGLA